MRWILRLKESKLQKFIELCKVIAVRRHLAEPTARASLVESGGEAFESLAPAYWLRCRRLI